VNEEHKIREQDCLTKTQLSANKKLEVLEVNPAQWLYLKFYLSRDKYNDD